MGYGHPLKKKRNKKELKKKNLNLIWKHTYRCVERNIKKHLVRAFTCYSRCRVAFQQILMTELIFTDFKS